MNDLLSRISETFTAQAKIIALQSGVIEELLDLLSMHVSASELDGIVKGRIDEAAMLAAEIDL